MLQNLPVFASSLSDSEEVIEGFSGLLFALSKVSALDRFVDLSVYVRL